MENFQNLRGDLLFLRVTAILLILILYSNVPAPIITGKAQNGSNSSLINSLPHNSLNNLQIPYSNKIVNDPIVINSNQDFEAFGFPGNGSKSNPFKIEGLF